MTNAFRLGFSTLSQEVTLDQLPVQGHIPSWLAGTLLRNGPGQFEVGEQRYRHWFDGLGMLHRFSFHQGRVSYANRFLQSELYSKTMESGKISYRQFAIDPCRTAFQDVSTLYTPSNNANVNIAYLNEQFVAMTETPLPIAFDPQTLDTLGVVSYQDDLEGRNATAHPHYDARTQATINALVQFGQQSHYHLYALLPGALQRRLIGSIPVEEPAYIHTFGMTEHYVILAEFPLLVYPSDLQQNARPFIENFVWKPERGTRFFVIRKLDGSLVGTYQGTAFFAFHHVNAYEEGESIIVDIAAYADASFIQELYLDQLTGNHGGATSCGELRRYRLPLHGSYAEEAMLSSQLIELPRINYHQSNTQPYRFAYGVSKRQDRLDDFWNQLVKIDVQERTSRAWFQDRCYPGEPVFVASPQARHEDDGVILSVVLDAQKGTSFLLLLDAASFEERGRAEVPHPIPFGFHGIYSNHARQTQEMQL